MAASTIAEEPNRRDFLYVATGAMGAVGAGFAAWPLIDQMSPDATTLAAASAEVDIANIAEGQIVTVKWRGKPIFISHRTQKEIATARAVPLGELRDPESDESRVQKPEWLILIGICASNCRTERHEAWRRMRRTRCLRSAEARDLRYRRFENAYLVPERRHIRRWGR